MSDRIVLNGTSYNDTIEVTEDYTLVNAGDGNDKIKNYYPSCDNVTINGGSGNDVISNSGWDVIVNGEDGDDIIDSNEIRVTVNAGNGNDNIYMFQYSDSFLVDGGDGNDTIGVDLVYAKNGATIDSGQGNDYINIDFMGGTSSKPILTTGDGNDTISFGIASSNKVTITDFNPYEDEIRFHKMYMVYYTSDSIENFESNNDNEGNLVLKFIGDYRHSTEITFSGITNINQIANAKVNNFGTITRLKDLDINGNGRNANIPSDAMLYNGHYYYIYSDVVNNWEEAKSFCENLGGHLVTITSKEEQNIVENLLANKGTKNNYWLGGYKDNDNKWKWITEEEFNFTNWSYKDPDNYKGVEDALMIYKERNPWDLTNLGDWNDVCKDGSCDGDLTFFGVDNFGFICEWDNSDTNDDDNDIASLTDLVQMLETFMNLGSETVKANLTSSKDELEKLKNSLLSSNKGAIRLLSKLFNESTKYTIVTDTDGNTILGADGKPYKIKDESSSRSVILAGFGAISNINSIADSAIKIGKGELRDTALLTEEMNLSKNIVSLGDNLAKLGGKGGIITPLGNYVLGLATNIVSLSDGANKKEVSNIIDNGSKLATELLKQFSTNFNLKYTTFGKWLNDSTLGKTLAKGANSKNANIAIAAVIGLYMGFAQYQESAEAYDIDGLPDNLALTNTWIDSIGTGVHSFANSFTLGLDDVAFEVLHTTAASIQYGFRWLKAMITGGDTSAIKFNTTGGKNYMEIIGDFIKMKTTGQTSGTKNDDRIVNGNDAIPIESREGDDYISNFGSNVSIFSGLGNDTIYNETMSSSDYVDGGHGEDFIVSYGKNHTIHGGLNNDRIFLSSSTEVAMSGNKIYGDDGDDVIILNDKAKNDEEIETNIVNGGRGDDVIVLDEAKKPSIIEYANGDGNDVIYGYKSDDRIRLTDESDFTTILSGKDVMVQVGDGLILLSDAADKDIHITKYSVLPNMMYSNNYKDLTLNQYFNGTLKDYNAKVKKIDAREVVNQIEIMGNAQNNSIHGGDKNDTIFGGKGDDKLYGGYGDDVFVYNDGDGNDTIYDYAEGQDKIKINKSIKSTKVSWLGSDFVFKLGNGKITVKNGKTKKIEIIDKDGNSTYYGTYLTVTEADNKTVKVENNVLNIDVSKRKTNIKLTANSLKNTILGGSGVNSIYSGAGDDIIFSNASDDKLFGEAGNDLIDGGAGNDSIQGGNGNDKLYGSDGDDTIQGGKGNDTLIGGVGKDTFIYANGDGNDVITDYTVAKDKIKITGNKITKTSISDSDVILTVGKGSIRIIDGKDKKLSIYNNASNVIDTIIGSSSSNTNSSDNTSTSITLTNSTTSQYTADSKIKNINATSRTTAIRINGNSIANTIKGGSNKDTIYGGAGNDSVFGGAGTDKLYGDNGADTLNGGKGNDTLTGGNGNDVFVYTNGDGNDIIADYTAKQDKIKLTSGTISSSSLKGSDVILKIDSGSITIKNGKNKSITVVDSKNKSTSKVYGTSSKNYIEKLWFENDDSVADDEIAAITQQNITSDNKFNNATGQLINYDTDNILLNNQQITSSLAYNRKK